MKTRKYKFVVECLGTVHFLRGRGGLWDLGGGHPKKDGLKRGVVLRKKGKRGVT